MDGSDETRADATAGAAGTPDAAFGLDASSRTSEPSDAAAASSDGPILCDVDAACPPGLWCYMHPCERSVCMPIPPRSAAALRAARGWRASPQVTRPEAAQWPQPPPPAIHPCHP
jgi:hypothetical protein